MNLMKKTILIEMPMSINPERRGEYFTEDRGEKFLSHFEDGQWDRDHISSWYKEVTEQEHFTAAQLISFGNYLLSPEREINVSEVNKRNVTHADFENWKSKPTLEYNVSPEEIREAAKDFFKTHLNMDYEKECSVCGAMNCQSNDNCIQCNCQF